MTLPAGRPMRIAVVTPVLNDWEALAFLIRDIGKDLAASGIAVRMIVVYDGSSLALDVATLQPAADGPITRIDVVTLGANLGHQRAIAVGLTLAAEAEDLDAVVVMDSDGEDRSSDIIRMVEAFRRGGGAAVLATRVKRHESMRFKLGYLAYKLLFRMLIGRQINFGNFALLPIMVVRRLGYMPDLWNNLPAAVLRSGVPTTAIPTERGFRYAGQSKMNLVSLIVHGLSAISVYVDTIFVRVLIGAFAFAAVSIIAIIVVIVMRFTTDLAIPGWTTNVVAALMIMLVQTIVLVVATSLLLLAGRSSRPIIPRSEARHFIDFVWTAWPRSLASDGGDGQHDPGSAGAAIPCATP